MSTDRPRSDTSWLTRFMKLSHVLLVYKTLTGRVFVECKHDFRFKYYDKLILSFDSWEDAYLVCSDDNSFYAYADRDKHFASHYFKLWEEEDEEEYES